jgi:hypothetical protein
MILQIPWFERKFNFDFPAGLFPCILERLRGTAPRIKAMSSHLPQDVLTTKPDGTWSVLEHIGHLVDLEELHEARIDDFKRRMPVLRIADLKNRKTDEAGHNSKSTAELVQLFQRSREHFLGELLQADDEALLFTSRHPRLNQPMRLIDMAFFVAEHDDHHITKIRSQIEGSNAKLYQK